MTERAQKITMAIVAAALALDLAGFLGWLHPRRCPACRAPYHRGRKCDWTTAAGRTGGDD